MTTSLHKRNPNSSGGGGRRVEAEGTVEALERALNWANEARRGDDPAGLSRLFLTG